MRQKNLENKITGLIEETTHKMPHAGLIREMILTTLRFSETPVTENEIQIIHTALKEMRYGFKFFAAYKNIRKVSVFGSARTKPSEPIYEYSKAFAQQIAEKGFMVITGAGDGIMRAAQEGAGRRNSFGINIILPFEQAANEFIQNDPKLMTFKYFFTRKFFFIKEADGITLFPGGFGTHDEGFEAMTLLQTGKTDPMPIVFIDEPGGTYWKSWLHYIEEEFIERGLISPEDLHLFKVTDRIDTAVNEITTFYKNYHSSCFVDEKLVVRMRHPIEDVFLERLNDHFSDIVVQGRIGKTEPLSKEESEMRDNPELRSLHRISFHFNQKSFGRFRQMIDMINTFSIDGKAEG